MKYNALTMAALALAILATQGTVHAMEKGTLPKTSPTGAGAPSSTNSDAWSFCEDPSRFNKQAWVPKSLQRIRKQIAPDFSAEFCYVQSLNDKPHAIELVNMAELSKKRRKSGRNSIAYFFFHAGCLASGGALVYKGLKSGHFKSMVVPGAVLMASGTYHLLGSWRFVRLAAFIPVVLAYTMPHTPTNITCSIGTTLAFSQTSILWQIFTKIPNRCFSGGIEEKLSNWLSGPLWWNKVNSKKLYYTSQKAVEDHERKKGLTAFYVPSIRFDNPRNNTNYTEVTLKKLSNLR